ncbi:acyltransferase [Sphingomonas ginkgonis]|uniref:Acyltransferase n=1 Tax=Sphingomonas ginkgonis TaxID=2315330 RepID=A0A429V881_9SPHN|nr:acyltransferase [Sphingomonas ginkgonis]RST30170.1 acyltransferase [Sphingomonas ginkgonis]
MTRNEPSLPPRRFETVQALRFAAAGLVVLAHCASGYFLPGTAGVDLFFVISGFIITRLLSDRSALEFAADRLTRIYPIYWLASVPLLVMGWDGSLQRLLTSLTLWPWFGELKLPFLVVGWTLSFEMLFYLGAGLVLWSRRTIPLLGLAYLLFLGFGYAGAHPLFAYLGNPMVLEFLAGVLIACLPLTRFRAIGLLAALAGIIAIPLLGRPEFGWPDHMLGFTSRAFLWGPFAALIVWGALQWEGAFRGRLWDWIVEGGDASYSLYLVHPTILLLAPANPYLKLALMPLVCVAASFPFHWWVERPLTQASRRLLRLTPSNGRSRPPAIVAVAQDRA